MNSKKVILVILEGATDQQSIGLILDELIPDNESIVILVYHGDITSDRGVNPKTVKSKLGSFITSKINRVKTFKKSDIKEIIHIVDIDGTFVESDKCYEDPKYLNYYYKESGIYFYNKNEIISRNEKKSSNLNVLAGMNSLFNEKVPYRIFYFSQNLEHVLYNKLNLESNDKRRLARKFEDKYFDNPEIFLKDFLNARFSVNLTYEESWVFIKESDNSLKRYSNLNLFLKELINENNK